MKHYLNGNFVKEDELLVSPRDLGFSRGFSVFEFFRTYNNKKPFRLIDHIERLFSSAHEIRMPMPWTVEEIVDIVLGTVKENQFCEGELAMRLIVSGGIASFDNIPKNPNLMIIVDQAIDFPEDLYLRGIKVQTLEHQRVRPQSKTVNYIEAISYMEEVKNANASEIIYTREGFFREGAFSNFFVIMDGELITTPNEVLQGITRKTVLEDLDISITPILKEFHISNILRMSEAFITMSGKGIVPVVEINNHVLGDGTVGSVTKEVMQKYQEYIASDQWYYR